jgi:soluble calcium-activated nucleotidase 1
MQGYVIHEAASWSAAKRMWVFLPRRVSSLPYDEELDEKMGSNKMLIAEEDFSKVRRHGGRLVSCTPHLLKLWFPRQCSGSNSGVTNQVLIPLVAPLRLQMTVRDVGKVTPERGFSSFKFVPGTNDEVILALKSMEEAATGKQASYLTVFNMNGEVLIDETPVPGAHKFEGIEFS